MTAYTLIFPHQLFTSHPALALERPVCLLEHPLFFGGDRHWNLNFHKQKILLHRASMKAYEQKLVSEGYQVEYLNWTGQSSSFRTLFSPLMSPPSALYYCDPVDDILNRRLIRYSKRNPVTLHTYDTPNFLTTSDTLAQLLGNKKPFMATFYKAQRKRLQVLIDPDGKTPTGGKWSYDQENRKALPKKQIVPEPPKAPVNPLIKDADQYCSEHFPKAYGSSYAFSYPITHEEAEEWLQHFFKERFALFGDYEDAISTKHKVLFHSVLTPALNIGLLTPQYVLEQSLRYAEQNQIPLNSLEGFIRQIIGWREFMRAMYIKYGVQERNSNFWGFTRSMPPCFYDGTTGILPIDQTIHGILEDGYCHHIERLMLLGNFMLLCRIHPTEVYKWFMELFIDSYDWVMVPNIYGMSQFADGGLFTTKPYISGSNYIRKMSDYKKGPWCDAWDGLFWSFIGDYHGILSKNARMNRMCWMYDKMDSEKRGIHYDNAEQFLQKLDA